MRQGRIEFALVRHGESEGNLGGRVLGGQMTPDLTARGRTQARAAARELAVWGADALWSSDMVRARRTAGQIALRTGLPVRSTGLLREQNHGRLDGAEPGSLVAEATPPGLDVTEVRWGGGESVVDVYARLRVFCGQIVAGAHSRIIVVGHSDMGCCFVSMLAGLGHRRVRWDRLRHGQVVYLSWVPGQQLPV
ncbi:histidine phosphatase family protein [uncultured Propionibacterium sp.]|uniref:histidine phosphatase family protein n=1 Tax=uncultured Propionibacterium sp. TaxID=218066 RepID=UPI00292DA90E|nr:histidine phosphatase family protein [uncultured Propionibacterium sp.]